MKSSQEQKTSKEPEIYLWEKKSLFTLSQTQRAWNLPNRVRSTLSSDHSSHNVQQHSETLRKQVTWSESRSQLNFFSLMKTADNYGCGHSFRRGRGSFPSNGRSSKLMNMLDSLFKPDFVLWLKVIATQFITQERTEKLIMCPIFHGIITLNV